MTSLRTLVDAVVGESEPISHREFRLFAIVGIAISFLVVTLFLYGRTVDAERRPPSGRRHVDAGDVVQRTADLRRS